MIFNKLLKFSCLFIVALLGFSMTTLAQAKDPIEHNWYNKEQTAKINIYKATDGKYYGKIVWLKEPNENGKPKVDKNNPDDKLRSNPILGLLILKGFSKTEDKLYENGTIYDPKNGKTYSCKITHKGNKLDVRGFVGFSMLGRTDTWTIAD